LGPFFSRIAWSGGAVTAPSDGAIRALNGPNAENGFRKTRITGKPRFNPPEHNGQGPHKQAYPVISISALDFWEKLGISVLDFYARCLFNSKVENPVEKHGNSKKVRSFLLISKIST